MEFACNCINEKERINTLEIYYILDTENEEIFEKILFNTTLLTTSAKANGVLKETIEILEFIER